jgi:hypothetical protein
VHTRPAVPIANGARIVNAEVVVPEAATGVVLFAVSAARARYSI